MGFGVSGAEPEAYGGGFGGLKLQEARLSVPERETGKSGAQNVENLSDVWRFRAIAFRHNSLALENALKRKLLGR